MISVIFFIIIGFLIIGIIGDIGFGGVILLVLGVFLVFVLIAVIAAKLEEHLKKNNPEKWEQMQKRRQAEEKLRNEEERRKQAKMYNNYKYKCPMCGSNKIRNLSFDEKTKPLSAGSRIGKNYHCDSCKYIW